MRRSGPREPLQVGLVVFGHEMIGGLESGVKSASDPYVDYFYVCTREEVYVITLSHWLAVLLLLLGPRQPSMLL